MHFLDKLKVAVWDEEGVPRRFVNAPFHQLPKRQFEPDDKELRWVRHGAHYHVGSLGCYETGLGLSIQLHQSRAHMHTLLTLQR
jgi:hypothetical protein